jgi:hypothetical protein
MSGLPQYKVKEGSYEHEWEMRFVVVVVNVKGQACRCGYRIAAATFHDKIQNARVLGHLSPHIFNRRAAHR